VWYALPTVAGGKCADIAIGCAGLLLALEGVPTFSEEHAQQLDYIDNLRAVDRRDTEVHQNVFFAVEAGWGSGNRLPDRDDGKSAEHLLSCIRVHQHWPGHACSIFAKPLKRHQ